MTKEFPLGDALGDLADGLGGRARTSTGFRGLDEILDGGFRPGQLVIVSGETSHGKSTFCLNAIRHAAIRDNRDVLVFNLESGTEQLTQRALSAEAGVPLSAMLTGRMTEEHWEKVEQAVPDIETAPIYIDDSTHTLPGILAESRRMASDHDVSMIVVDYLNLVIAGREVETRQQEVSMITRELKLLAQELDVPIVAVSQLSRGIEARGEDPLPRLDDLRDSGTVEQDADVVIFVDRPDARNKDHLRVGEVNLIVAKNRAGRTSAVTVAHQLHYCRFVDFYTPNTTTSTRGQAPEKES